MSETDGSACRADFEDGIDKSAAIDIDISKPGRELPVMEEAYVPTLISRPDKFQSGRATGVAQAGAYAYDLLWRKFHLTRFEFLMLLCLGTIAITSLLSFLWQVFHGA